jgi:transposase
VARQPQAARSRACASVVICCYLLFLPPYSPELHPAEHLWRLTNTALANRHFATIDDLEDAQAARCVALQVRPDLIRSATRFHWFHWWPQRIKKRQGPKLK